MVFQNSVNAAADAADNGASNGTGIGLGAGLPSAAGRSGWKSIAGKVTSNGLAWTFLGKNAAAIINALDQVTQVRLLQTPSVFVRNNAEATLNVGARIQSIPPQLTPVWAVTVPTPQCSTLIPASF